MARVLDDWLEYYLKFSQNTESPRLYHVWTGIVTIASVMQRKCWLDWGFDYIYPNLYVVLVGPPGGRKGTAMKVAKPFMHELKIPLASDSLGSVQTLYHELMNSIQTAKIGEKIVEHRSLSVWSEEFQVFLIDNDPRLITSLTDLYDCPSRWAYSTLKRGIEDLSNCWLTIFGCITPSLLQANLTQAATGGGLISRMIFVVGYGREKSCPITFLSQEERELKDKLLEDLTNIRLLSGQFKPTPKFIEDYIEWYSSPAATAGVDSDKFIGYNNRRALHVRKLCMILSASQGDSMKLTSNHLKKALYILQHTEREMPNAFFGIGKGLHSAVMTDLLRYITVNENIPVSNILRRFQLDALPHELETYLNALSQNGSIRRYVGKDGKMWVSIIKQACVDNTTAELNQTLFKHLE